MDVIKKEPEIDFLAIKRSNNTDMEDQKPFSEEGNVLDLQVIEIKTECVDHSYDVKTEMTFDETSVQIDFSFVKSEAEEGAHELNTVEEEVKLEIMEEEDEVLTESYFCTLPFFKCKIYGSGA
ncbi:uncharacterized protein [Periplaneta americana]|uniref:uncharacterized protein isoform X2 n=1 Tax=Periplaneta americana TaxID=6978 RepID=UPI0037E865D1